MDTTETMLATIEILKARGLDAAFDYPGFISVYDVNEHGTACFGDLAGDEYGANYMDEGPEIDFAMPLTATPEELADAIVKAVVR